MRPAQPIVGEEPVPEVIYISSDSEDMEQEDPEEPGPEVIVISSDSEDEVEENLEDIDQEEIDIPLGLDGGGEDDLEDTGPDEIDILQNLEDGEIWEVPDIPMVNNQVRMGHWEGGFWCTPGNRRNYGPDLFEGHGVWSINEPPMDGVDGGLCYLGERNQFKDTLGGLLYKQWLQNKDKPVTEHVTVGGSIYNDWLESRD
jgi:hypothetical protein